MEPSVAGQDWQKSDLKHLALLLDQKRTLTVDDVVSDAIFGRGTFAWIPFIFHTSVLHWPHSKD